MLHSEQSSAKHVPEDILEIHVPRVVEGLGSEPLYGHHGRLLSHDEELCLIKRVLEGDEKAKDPLIACNYGLIIDLAHKCKNPKVPMADLVQEGLIGFIQAIKKFDPEKGVRLGTYATYWILCRMKRAIINQGGNIRIPLYAIDIARKASEIARRYEMSEGTTPSNRTIAEEMKIDPEKLESLLEIARGTLSLDHPTGDDDSSTLADFVASKNATDPLQAVIESEDRDQLNAMLSSLTDIERMVIEKRMGLDDGECKTLSEIAHMTNRSTERMRQIEAKAKLKLRRYLLAKMSESFPTRDTPADPRSTDNSCSSKADPSN